MNGTNEIVLFETEDKDIILNVPIEQDTVWLNRNQMAELFDRDVKTIDKHINNALKEELDGRVVVAKFATTTPHGAIKEKTQTRAQSSGTSTNFPRALIFGVHHVK